MSKKKDRITAGTNKFRWFRRRNPLLEGTNFEVEKVLQQQFRTSDKHWIDWQGDNTEYEWRDVPVINEGEENEVQKNSN